MIPLLIILHTFEAIFVVEASEKDVYYTVTPSNLAVVAGNPLRLNCGFVNASNIHWHYQSHSTKANGVFIYNGEAISNKMFPRDLSVDSSSAERRDLVANETMLEHAGVYDCIALTSTDSAVIDQRHSAKAQLIVLASDPVCWSNLSKPGYSATEFDTVLIQCDLEYAGQWSPTMEWFKQIHHQSDLLEPTSYQFLNAGYNLSSFISMKVNSTDNGVAFICKTQFTSSGTLLATNASNIPDYLYYWNITINVEYGPKNIVVQPLQDSYDVNSILSCKADGNPVPEYTWQDMETLAITNGQAMVISKGIADNDAQYTFKCTAQNMVNGRTMKDSVMATVRIKGTYAVRNVTISIGILCILLMAVIFYVSRTYIKDGCEHIQSVFMREEDNSEPDVVPDVQGVEEDYDNLEREPLPYNGYVDMDELAAGNAEVDFGRNPDAQNHHDIRENDAGDMDRPVQIVLPVYAEVKKINRLQDTGFNKQKPLGESGERINLRYYGSDGTEYVEMNAFVQKPKPEPLVQSSVLETAEYASIDHRLTPSLLSASPR